MRTLLALALAVSIPAAIRADDQDKLVRELELKSPKIGVKKGAQPADAAKITSKAELEQLITDEPTREAIAKIVDFEKSYLLIFAWAGSGGDKIAATDEKGEAVFTVTRGKTKDLRQHLRVFAVAKDAKWSVAK